ncbi:hypothetical protein [Pseudomonas syringae]|uniref:hypothetical protein n=1 Tax=Pseudomonas syringae TaxID=317 RepID=UPI001F3892D3|nr:hypothetical protein [Pseudomonas syringae]MCF5494708.1 hypothetical protein [Pseudomonas syringae]
MSQFFVQLLMLARGAVIEYGGLYLSLLHISVPTRQCAGYRMPSFAFKKKKKKIDDWLRVVVMREV